MEVLVAHPRGFCAGVVRAIEIVERALEIHGPPVYVLHEIVHNGHVLDELRTKGAVFVEDIDGVPPGSVLVFSAHGVSKQVVRRADNQRLRVIDATCPLVTRVHLQTLSYHRRGYEIIMIGHPGHAEVEGTRGQLEDDVHVISDLRDVDQLEVRDPDRVAYVTQTTLSLDDTRELIAALKRRFPAIQGPELTDICYATQNRQNGVRMLVEDEGIDVLLVVGARNSSNSNRLREVGELRGLSAYLIENASEIDPAWITGRSRVGITAGASTPEVLVEEVIERLRKLGAERVAEAEGIRESTVFSLPSAEEFNPEQAPCPPSQD